jgi:hypothetical protein
MLPDGSSTHQHLGTALGTVHAAAAGNHAGTITPMAICAAGACAQAAAAVEGRGACRQQAAASAGA